MVVLKVRTHSIHGKLTLVTAPTSTVLQRPKVHTVISMYIPVFI
jgi:hypothetical protein